MDVFLRTVETKKKKDAFQVLMQLSESYLSEMWYSALVSIKTQKQERLKSAEDEMQVYLSKMCPSIKEICKCHVPCFTLNVCLNWFYSFPLFYFF
jgi:hypothetical protein